MINPEVRAKDRIYSELPEELKTKMQKYVLSEEEHLKVLEDIKEESYKGKTPVKNPKFILVAGQTGSGKSNLTRSIYEKQNNLVVIDSDKYKAYRGDTQEILNEHPAEYGFLTAPDSYLHRDEMIMDALEKKYNILMECAPSEKEGFFIDFKNLKERGYNIAICVLGVSPLNSILSAHERYEADLELKKKSAKLTSINRHDDSYTSLNKSIQKEQNNKDVSIFVYERGKEYPYTPELVYSSKGKERRFSCPLEALMHTQQKDEMKTMQNCEKRIETIKEKMELRNAPAKQIEQLQQVQERFENEKQR